MAHSNVQVVCRLRPLNARELALGGNQNHIEIFDDSKTIQVKERGRKIRITFDAIFDTQSTQKQVYQGTALPFLKDLMSGYNTTIFAYGQTGSGKTHTMMGEPKDDKMKGLIPSLLEGVFDEIEDAESSVEFTVKLSYIEIYNEKIRDLLNPDKDNLRVRQNGNGGVWIEDVEEHYVSGYDEVIDLIGAGQSNRAMAATGMNDQSSRSHSVFIMTLGQTQKDTGTKKAAKLFLVDLAGSEKVRKTGAEGATLTEAKHINKSLSALGNVINALTSSKEHVPYRDSKLTRILSDSLGGNSKTCLVITCSPALSEAEETISTCRFGSRAKEIKNKPKINQERSVAEYKKLLLLAYKQIELQKTIIAGFKRNNDTLREQMLQHGISPGSGETSASALAEASNNCLTEEAQSQGAIEAESPTQGGQAEQKGKTAGAEMEAKDAQIQALKNECEELKAKLDTVEESFAAMIEVNKKQTKRKVSKPERKGTNGSAEESAPGASQPDNDPPSSDSDGDFEVSVSPTASPERPAGEALLDADGVPPTLETLRSQFADEMAAIKDLPTKPGLKSENKLDQLMIALQNKCDQYLKLSVKYQNQKEYVRKIEEALQAAERREKLAQIGFEHEIKVRERLCKKLLESGIYWRQQRKKEQKQSRIVVPISGGGGGSRREKRESSRKSGRRSSSTKTDSSGAVRLGSSVRAARKAQISEAEWEQSSGPN